MDMKAEVGSIRKAMIRSGILFDKSPNEYQLEFGGVASVIKPQKHLKYFWRKLKSVPKQCQQEAYSLQVKRWLPRTKAASAASFWNMSCAHLTKVKLHSVK